MQREQELRRRQIRTGNGLVVSLDERKASACQKGCVATGSIASQGKRKGSPCHQEDSSQSGEEKGYPGPELPEDIWLRIHSLMPMRDAARAACVSRAFLCSWRSHPNLSFSEETLGLKGMVSEKLEIARDYANKVDHILKGHSGVGVKTFQLFGAPSYTVKDHHYLDSWLQMAVKPGIEELAISPCSGYEYKFPCSLLSDGNGDSIQSLHFASCAFHPTVGFGCLRSLTSLYLYMVHITGNELGWLLSSSFALERFTLRYCCEIYRFKIPCHLRRLRYLEVLHCSELKVIESEAPNLSYIRVAAGFQLELLLGGAASQVKNLNMYYPGAVRYTCTKLASSMPNLETLDIESTKEMVNKPMVSSRFLHLKYLNIYVTMDNSPRFDYYFLVSLIDASPSLASLVLDVSQRRMEHVSIFEDPSELRQMPEQMHGKLQNVQFSGFSSAKSLIELTRHILGVSTSLKKLVLNTRPGRCVHVRPDYKIGKCFGMERDHIVEAFRAVSAIEIYIKPKVPSTVNLFVRAPCSRCHVIKDLGDPTPRLSTH